MWIIPCFVIPISILLFVFFIYKNREIIYKSTEEIDPSLTNILESNINGFPLFLIIFLWVGATIFFCIPMALLTLLLIMITVLGFGGFVYIISYLIKLSIKPQIKTKKLELL